MTMQHHGDANELASMRRLMDQIQGTARREYPKGRMGHEDDGALSYAIAADPRHSTIVIRFGKPVEWIGLGEQDTRDLITKLEGKLLELRGIAVWRDKLAGETTGGGG